MDNIVQIAVYSALVALSLLGAWGVFKLVARLMFGEKQEESDTSEAVADASTEERDGDVEYFANYGRCLICDDIATARCPRLVRERVPRRLLAPVIPTYCRKVDDTGEPELCATHAHLADAEVDLFIRVEIQGDIAKASNQIARKAAQFEMDLIQKLKSDYNRSSQPKLVDSSKVSSLRPLKTASKS